MNQQRRVTIRDVALAAGVSVTTVSDSLGGGGRIPQVTRERVRGVATELGYIANRGAQNLRRGRAGVIGLYFPQRSINLQYYMDLAMGAADEALANELALTLIPTPRDTAKVSRLPLDGVIAADPALGDPVLAALSALRVPMVTCERDLTPGAEPAGVIESDHRAATVALLDQMACTDVALVVPGEESSFARDIRQAYLSWCADHAAVARIREVPFASTAQDAGAAVRELLAARRPPRGIICVPDGTAAVAMQVASETGRRVPADLLIASYVDGEELRRLPVPVTAVDLNPRAMGRRAAALMAQLLEGRVEPGARLDLPIELCVRASTLA